MAGEVGGTRRTVHIGGMVGRGRRAATWAGGS